MSWFGKKLSTAEGTEAVDAAQNGGKAYTIVVSCATVGLFLTVGLLIMGVILQFITAPLTLTLAILAIVCFFAISMLPWIKKLERGQFYKTSIAFLAINALCCMLWIVGAVLIFILYQKAHSGMDFDASGYLEVIKIILLITIQFLAASSIATLVFRYKRTFVAFQVITYISIVFVDLYVSIFLLSITFNSAQELIFNQDILNILGTPIMLGFFVMFLVFTIISAGIVKRIERGKVGRAYEAVTKTQDQLTPQNTAENEENSLQSRLQKLKSLYDAGLISEEEYKARKAEILQEI